MMERNRTVRGSWYRGALAVALGCLLFSFASSATAGEPKDFVKDETEDVTELLDQQESEERAQAFSEKARELIDFRTLASRALGEHWDERNDEERDQFLELLQTLLEANYKGKLEGKTLGEDYEIEYTEEKRREDRAIVRTKVVYRAEEEGEKVEKFKPVEYKLMKKEEGWVIYDLVIDDISLEETYRDSYTKIIEKEGWDALIEKMKKKAEKVREKSAEGAGMEAVEKEKADQE